jgi:hypothetical protein
MRRWGLLLVAQELDALEIGLNDITGQVLKSVYESEPAVTTQYLHAGDRQSTKFQLALRRIRHLTNDLLLLQGPSFVRSLPKDSRKIDEIGSLHLERLYRDVLDVDDYRRTDCQDVLASTCAVRALFHF